MLLLSRVLIKISDFFLIPRLMRIVESSVWIQFFLLFAISILVMWFFVCFYSTRVDDFLNFYDQRLRGFLFSGFLTVGSFLLSLKTFVVVSLKDKLFDSPSYIARYKSLNRLEEDGEIDYKDLYKPLSNLTGFLFFSILFSIGTAVAQFSIGLMKNEYVIVFCIWMALFTVFLLMNSLRLIRKNLLVWLGYK